MKKLLIMAVGVGVWLGVVGFAANFLAESIAQSFDNSANLIAEAGHHG